MKKRSIWKKVTCMTLLALGLASLSQAATTQPPELSQQESVEEHGHGH